MGTLTNHPLKIRANNTDILTLTASGNVGISTTTPWGKLSVTSGAGGGDTSSSAAVGRFHANTAGFTGASLIAENTLGADSSYRLFEAATDADGDAGGRTVQFVIRGDGNVGIGTTSPNSKLTVYNGSADSAIEFSSASGDTYKWTMGMDYSDAGKFKIASSTVLGTLDRFVIDGSGKIGIGTSTPARKLDVVDSANPQLRLSQATDVYTDFSVAAATGDLTVSLYPGASANDITFNSPDGSDGANLWLCGGAACPSGISFTGGGNLYVEGQIKYATSTSPKTRRSIILTAAGAITPTSGGAAKSQVDGTNHSYYVLDFDASSDEAAYWHWTMPDSYDNGAVDITYYWEAAATSNDAIFCFQAKGLGSNNSEDIDSALSSAVCETDTAQANANDLASMTESGAASNFTAGEYVMFKVFRDADAGGDTMSGDARLVKVKIEYGVAAESD